MIGCLWSLIRVNPQCAVAGWLTAVCPKQRGGEGGFLYFVTRAELACFDDFSRNLLTNPVRYLHVCLQNGILWARQTKSSAISCFLSEFQVFGPWYLSEFVRRLPLKFSLEHGRSPCSSHCGRSKWRGLAVKACFSKQPRDSSNSGWVTLSCVSKAQSLGGVLLWDFDCS